MDEGRTEGRERVRARGNEETEGERMETRGKYWRNKLTGEKVEKGI